MIIKRNSWHYKFLQAGGWHPELNKNVCSYVLDVVWLMVLAFFGFFTFAALGFIALGYVGIAIAIVIMACIVPINRYLSRKIENCEKVDFE